jgi:hypothetical protein
MFTLVFAIACPLIQIGVLVDLAPSTQQGVKISSLSTSNLCFHENVFRSRMELHLVWNEELRCSHAGSSP